MAERKIRVTVKCVFLHDDRILVKECFDDEKQELFYRPLGGGVEFGEHSADALKREIKEELGADITLPEFIGVLENHAFTFRGEPGHEIAFIYDAKFLEPAFYRMPEVPVDENGVACKAIWKPLSFFIRKEAPLFPEGLLELLLR